MTECRAAVPVERFVSATGRMLGDSPVFDHVVTEPSWRECGKPSTAVYEYSCEAGHVKVRENCADHEPEPRAVGCRDCWDAGTERPMTYRQVT